MKKLGIIGGMGPAATARLFMRVINFTLVSRDQDHLDITVLNRPSIPDRTEYLLEREGACNFVPAIQETAQELERAGCAVLALPCNTAHARINEIEKVLSTAHLVDMLKETAHFLDQLDCVRPGMLTTDGTRATGVYDVAFSELGISPLWPEGALQQEVMSIIYDYVKAGREAPQEKFNAVCSALIEAGCDCVVLGCTELSVIGAPSHREGVPIIDTLDVLAWRCVQACGAPAYDLTKDFR